MTEAELERLAILVEEAAEVQQIAMKIIRHGYSSCNPFDNNATPNRELLNKELGDLMYAVELMTAYYDVNPSAIAEHKANKRSKISQYLHFNEA